jgi:hypothetical protein
LSLARRALKDKFPTPTVPLTAMLPNRQVFLPDPVLLWTFKRLRVNDPLFLSGFQDNWIFSTFLKNAQM